MALLHQAELRPSKLELLDSWAPSQPWYLGAPGVGLTNVASYRFDDPEGEVGVETILVRAGDGPIMQVPLSYRNAPLEGAETWLIATMQHSALGKRWVYDAVGDPVYLMTCASAAITGGHQADLFIEIDGEMVQREPTAVVSGSGHSDAAVALPAVSEIVVRLADNVTVAETASLTVLLARSPGTLLRQPALDAGRSGVLSGTWAGQAVPQPLLLAYLR